MLVKNEIQFNCSYFDISYCILLYPCGHLNAGTALLVGYCSYSFHIATDVHMQVWVMFMLEGL